MVRRNVWKVLCVSGFSLTTESVLWFVSLLPLLLFFSHKGWMSLFDSLSEGRAGSELWIVEWFCGSMGRSVD